MKKLITLFIFMSFIVSCGCSGQNYILVKKIKEPEETRVFIDNNLMRFNESAVPDYVFKTIRCKVTYEYTDNEDYIFVLKSHKDAPSFRIFVRKSTFTIFNEGDEININFEYSRKDVNNICLIREIHYSNKD